MKYLRYISATKGEEIYGMYEAKKHLIYMTKRYLPGKIGCDLIPKELFWHTFYHELYHAFLDQVQGKSEEDKCDLYAAWQIKLLEGPAIKGKY